MDVLLGFLLGEQPTYGPGGPSWLHWVGAALAVLAVGLYIDRSLCLSRQGTQTRWAKTTRVGMTLWGASVAGAFVDLAKMHQTFELRHAAIAVALFIVVLGHIGMRVTKAPPGTPSACSRPHQ